MLELLSSVRVHAPIERCFDITRSIDAHERSSVLIRGKAVAGQTTGLSELETETTWSASFFGFRFRVRTRVIEMEKPTSFAEEKVNGLPRTFAHQYQFIQEKDYTRIEDTFRIGLPLGFFSEKLLRQRLTQVQEHRLESIREICEGKEWRDYDSVTSPER